MARKNAKKNLQKPMMKFFNNKIVLYLVSLFSLFFVINKLLNNKFFDIFVFYLVAVLMFLYTKNMSVILIISLICTYLFSSYKGKFMKEGFKSKEGMETEDDEEEDDEEEAMTNGKKDDKKKQTEETANKRTGYQNFKKLKHSPVNADAIPNVSKKHKTKADEMEDAYDNFEKIMGAENIDSIGSSTQGLIKKQKELLSGIKEMTPVLGKAMDALNKMDLSNLFGKKDD